MVLEAAKFFMSKQTTRMNKLGRIPRPSRKADHRRRGPRVPTIAQYTNIVE
jgi:hypothetical protein